MRFLSKREKRSQAVIQRMVSAHAHVSNRCGPKRTACAPEDSAGAFLKIKQDIIAQSELSLLLACARTTNRVIDQTAIRRILEDGIDWGIFARKAINHGVASLVFSTMEKVAPDIIPDDLLNAVRMNKEYVRSRNDLICNAFDRSAKAVLSSGVDAIWFSGPVLGIHAYGHPDLRVFSAPTLLIREQTAIATITALRDIGYQQKPHLTGTQLDFIRYLQGQESLSNPSVGIGARLCIRLTPINMSLNIDYEGLWRRAQPATIIQQTVQTLAPDDEVLALSIQDHGYGIWPFGEACDFAALIVSQPNLDWSTIVERASAQGCLRMLLVAVSLARSYFGAAVPDEILAAEQADPIVETIVSRTVTHWHADEPSESLRDDGFSQALRLHDGRMRKVRYLVCSLVLPNPSHISRFALPRRFTNLFVYAFVKFAQDVAILPLLRTYRKMRAGARPLLNLLASHELGLFIPLSGERRLLLHRYNAKRAAAKRVLAKDSNDYEAWKDLGDALFGLERYDAAIAAYDKALGNTSEDLELWRKRAAAIRAGGSRVSNFSTENEIKLNPEVADAWARHAASMAALNHFSEAVTAADRALTIDPTHQLAARAGLRSRILSCDWRRNQDDQHKVADAFKAGIALLTPAGNRAICDSEAQNLIAAQLWSRRFVPAPAAISRGRQYRHDRIRLAYLSSEYHGHPVGRQIVGVLEHHDHSRFDITVISLGGPNSSAIRQRIQAAGDRFISVHEMSDDQIADIVCKSEIDIAIDLDRLAAKGRPAILARRPAPLQVSYFGNAGTTGAPFYDYIVADRTLIPGEQFRHYTEKVIYLPHSYQCNDSSRPVPPSTHSRTEAGLPEAGFVYCCFNQNYKIRPPVFDVWMRLLHACPGSVLWLLEASPHAKHNLRREAATRGIVADRIVFAPVVPNDDHLARHGLADLFLDTLPCNAHATASDALWAGLPVLTCMGSTFAGRVGASLLRAVGLSEMITESLSQYEALAISLALGPQRLSAIKAKLARNRDRQALFDTAGFTRDLEAAFEAIWRRHQAGLAPEAIAV